ncbi:MAG: hypothetical protein LBK23_08035 [Oscillospiraceae bacterium]|jgi:flagellin|nr:hypothetical protein [Oscillospiraceae bacterium]
MRIQNNVPALNAHRYYGINQAGVTKSIAKLSSGYRINSAADDAAGLAISEKMRAQIRGLTMASKNTQDAISLIQTAEGGMQEIDNMLQRIRELVVYASNDTQDQASATATDGDRQKIQDEINALVAEVDSMSERVEFNKKKLISGEYSGESAIASSTISRLKEKLKSAALAKETAWSDMNQSGANYQDFTKTGGQLKTAASAYLGGTAAATLTTGTYTATNTSTTAGAFAEVDYSDVATSSTSANSTLGELAGYLQDIADEAATLSTATTILDAKITGATQGSSEVNFNFKVALAGLGIHADADIKTLVAAGATGVDAYKGVPSATVEDVLLTDPLAPVATTGLFTNQRSLEVLREIAAYTDPDGKELTSEVKDAIDLAKNVVDAVDKYQKFVEPGGVFETAKQTYETYVKAEQDLKAEFNSKKDQWSVSKELESKAQAELEKAISLSTTTPAKSEGLYFQVGANAHQHVQLTIGSVKSDILGVGDGKGVASIDVLEKTGADITAQLDTLDQALTYVTAERSKLGAAQNRLEYTQNSLDISAENLTNAESRIRDVDMAKEMTQFTKMNILFQASTAMLAQANALPQGVLQMLG